MKTSAAILTACLLACAGAARAGEGETAAKPKEPAVTMAPVGLPVVAGGRVVNYVFVTVKLNLSPKADIAAVQEKEPFVRDALVRAGGRTPFVRPDSYMALDETRIRAAAMRAAAAVAGPGAVVSAEVVRQQAQHYAGLPTPPAARR